MLDSNTWNHLTVCKQIGSNFLKNKITDKLFPYKSYTSSRAVSSDFPDSLSLSLSSYRPSLLAGFPIYILGPQSAGVDKFLLVGQHRHDHGKRSL